MTLDSTAASDELSPQSQKTDRRIKKNEALKRSKKIELSGSERFFIQRVIEKMNESERTEGERRLLEKVR